MIDIKITTCAPSWPWLRQLPGNGPDWGPFRFHVDTDVEQCDLWFVFESLPSAQRAVCARENVVFITGEPDAIGGYSQRFLAQFGHVVSGRADVKHSSIIRSQQGHPWFVERSYDELKALVPIAKTRDLCVLTSAKAYTAGHQARLDFVRKLQQRLGDRVDVFGRGIRDFDSKWDALRDYRYSVVIENHHGPDFVTEKLPDAWLSYTVPFYWGCSNLDRYSDARSWIAIDPANEQQAFDLIESHLSDPGAYERYLPAVIRARNDYLDHMQFFALVRNLADGLWRTNATKKRESIELLTAGNVDVGRPTGLASWLRRRS